ncbi:MAG: RluA family pseudouridine synthase [Clostridia bacterium]|nr:RluA family pseudouridine synthase [Clostridia bacterium]
MEYTVKAEEAGKRVREILRISMGVSYTAMKSAKWNGRIRLNGENVYTDTRVEAGDTVCIDWAEETPAYRPRPFAMQLNPVWEDDALIILSKPAPLASQSSRNHPDDSLENAVYTYFGCPENFVFRPVNRLDRGTSGLMVIARNPHAQHLMQKELHTPRFRRRYLAWTDGMPEPPEGMIDLPIAKAPGASVRRIVSPEGKPSRTRYRVLEEKDGGALVLLELETGRTHQIRVHLSAIGCPVRGDFLYGQERPEEFPERFALHSAVLDMVHPMTGERICLTSLPDWADGIQDSVLLMDFD